ncbi:DUF6895 family protein [Streptomyces sp. NPDC014805]|uniref:DUF6895 family protein n=1 Tax=Streptomyces sp. NPDC014805 TaxID=3364919 RepID=UPI003702479D
MRRPAGVLPGVLGWLEENLRWFDPEVWERHLPRRPFPPGPLLELLGFLRLLTREQGPAAVPQGLREGALDLAERITGTPEFATRLRRADALFPYHLNVVALLGLLGRPRPDLLKTCEALLASGAGGHFQPHRPLLSRLELRYFADRAALTLPAGIPDRASLSAGSVPALEPDPLSLDDDEVYAFTHAVFYATDFGADDVPPGGALRDTVRVLLASHLIGGHLDLLAELLLCADLTGLGETDLARRSWAALASARRPDGAVPGPVHRPAVLSGLTGEKAEAYLFGTCYHTTLATGLAAVVRLGRGGTPEPDPPEDASSPATPPPYPPAGAPAEEVRAWAESIARAAPHAPQPHRQVWAQAVTGALTLAARRRDPVTLAALLTASGPLGARNTPLARAAAARLAAGWCS